jgi:hypothetical protein
MSDFHDPDDIVDVLRGPARADELSGEAEIVELMANAHLAARGTSMYSVSRRARLATLIAIGVIGFGGVAAAGSGGFDLSSLDLDGRDVTTTEGEPEQEAEESEIREEEEILQDEPAVEETAGMDDEGEEEETPEVLDVEEVEDEATAEGETRDNPDTVFDEADCVKDADGNELNHGKTVSAVARGEAPFENVDVRDAAHSDCGKQRDADVEETDDLDDDDEREQPAEVESDDDDRDDDADDDADDDDRAERSNGSKHADNGKSDNGKSKSSNGNGKGKKGDK